MSTSDPEAKALEPLFEDFTQEELRFFEQMIRAAVQNVGADRQRIRSRLGDIVNVGMSGAVPPPLGIEAASKLQNKPEARKAAIFSKLVEILDRILGETNNKDLDETVLVEIDEEPSTDDGGETRLSQS